MHLRKVGHVAGGFFWVVLVILCNGRAAPASQRGELMRVSPNPFYNKINIELSDFKNKSYVLKIVDDMGNVVLKSEIK